MAGKVISFFLDPDKRKQMKLAARSRAEDYKAEDILDRLLQDTGLVTKSCPL